MSVLHLVLGCDNLHYKPIETAAKETWIKESPDEIKTIFMYGNSSKIFWDSEDSFYVDRPEDHFYGICLYKTITAFEWFLETNFDYIYRTNNTGYFDLNKVCEFIKDKPKYNFYCGNSQVYEKSLNTPTAPYPGINYASGASFFLSRDIVEKIINDREIIYSYNLPGWCDDVSIGKYITEYLKIPIDSSSRRLNVNLSDVDENLDMSHYHYRILESANFNSDGNVKCLYKIHDLKQKNN